MFDEKKLKNLTTEETAEEKFNYLIDLLFSKLENSNIDLTEEEADNIPTYAKNIRSDLRVSNFLKKNIISRWEDDYYLHLTIRTSDKKGNELKEYNILREWLREDEASE